jgi:hypothetical protein
MGELGALFNPGMRHEIAERKAKAARREEEGNADPGNLRIDLLSGVAVITMGPKNHDAEENTVAENQEQGGQAAGRPEGVEADADGSIDDDRSEESVQSQDAGAAESTGEARADLGTAPQVNRRDDVDVDGEDAVHPDALKIAEQMSNSEPPP